MTVIMEVSARRLLQVVLRTAIGTVLAVPPLALLIGVARGWGTTCMLSIIDIPIEVLAI